MKGKLVLLLSVLLLGGSTHAAPLGTAFTYQGRLDDGGQPANGYYDMTFWLYAGPIGGSVLSSNIAPDVPVNDGLFTRSVDFGAIDFTGEERWLAITVATNGSSAFTLLQPRTRLAPAPNAIYASTAGNVLNVSVQASNLVTVGTPGPNQVLGYNGTSLAWLPPGGVTSVWTLNGTSAYYNSGRVGIGTANPGRLLQLGDVGILGSQGLMRLASRSGSGSYSRTWEIGIPEGGDSDGDGRNYSFVIDDTSLGTKPEFVVRYGSGNVGIGTTVPFYKLDVAGSGGFNGDLHVGGAETEAALGTFRIYGHEPRVGFPFPTRFIVGKNGNVGIRTASPQAALDIVGDWDGNRPALQLRGQKPTIKFGAEPDSGNQTWLMHLGSEGPGNLQFMHLSGFIYDRVLTLGANNNVGVGTGNPSERLHVNGRFLRVEGDGGEAAYIGGDGQGGEVHVGSLNPDVNTVAIYNSGASRWMNLSACSITIMGGCDLAEPFPMKEEAIEKGSVVVIDEEHPGRLKRSVQAYDTRVAGIVSGANGINPGISLKQEGVLDQGENVALTGRVYVKADASFGVIQPGDLLTTSDTPGHAMKVTDHTRAQGAILGKAMSALKEGQGLVLVLVTLQ